MEVAEMPDSDTTCSICCAEFLDPDDLTIHITQMHSSEPQSTFKLCQFCPIYLSSLEEYALHIRNTHLISLRSCKYCNRVFIDVDEYRKHESKHYTYVAKSLFSCSQCKKLFNNVSELELHEFKEHKDSIEGVFINECLPLLSSLLNIKALKFLQSMGDYTDRYACIMCQMTTVDPEDYLQHLITQDCKSIACDSCSSVYRNKKALVRHFDTHPECQIGSKRIYKQCTECFKMFGIRMWRDHTKHCKAIKCKICNVVFGTMDELSRHTTTVHPLTVMLEACKYCQKEFAGSQALNKHIERTHKHDAHLYKYVCIICNAIFKHPKRLFAHFYSTHKELEPYTCTICDKKFKIRKKFTIHIKLDHKSIGYIEFDEKYHVFFSDKKSVNVKPESMKEEKKENAAGVKPELDSARTVKTDNSEHSKEKKVTFDVEDKAEASLVNANSDFMSATETEGNQTEIEETRPAKRKNKIKVEGKAKKRLKKTSSIEYIITDSSDDEPLEELRKRAKNRKKATFRNATWNRKKRKDVNDNKKRFICNICKKYCYTFQNYHNHVALHYKNVTLKCVKCCESFSSKDELNKHYSTEHSSSQLTETLKNLLEKRKSGVQTISDLSSTELFQRTIKRVVIPKTDIKTTLTEVKDKLSVQKFIESFTPEDAPKKKLVEIDCSITIKPYTGPVKKPQIQLTRCNLTHMDYQKTNLTMPARFRQVIGETHKVTCKEMQIDDEQQNDLEETRYQVEDETYFDDDDADRNESIPEVAQEVMLEGSEDPTPKTLYVPHRVVLPKLPKEYKKIRIAHLQAEAPYYKIVKVEDVLNSQPQPEKKPKEPEDMKMDIKLPDGTKLVTVNPLAHLLGDIPVEKILENKKKNYYQPKSKDFEVAIAKAMLRLEKPEAFPKKKRKKSDAN